MTTALYLKELPRGDRLYDPTNPMDLEVAVESLKFDFLKKVRNTVLPLRTSPFNPTKIDVAAILGVYSGSVIGCELGVFDHSGEKRNFVWLTISGDKNAVVRVESLLEVELDRRKFVSGTNYVSVKKLDNRYGELAKSVLREV